MCTAIRRCPHSQPASSLALFDWLSSHFNPAPLIATVVSSSHRPLTTAALASSPTLSVPSSRSVHLSISQHRRLPSYPSDDTGRVTSAVLERSALKRSRTPPHVASPSHLSPSELRALSEAAVRERRRRLSARHRELSFLRKAPLLASSLPPSLAHIAPALPRTDFSYSWPCLSFRPVPAHRRPSAQPAFESGRQTSYERQLRARKAEKNGAIDQLKQTINRLQTTAIGADKEGEKKETYDECLEAVKRTRQLYSPLLTSNDYYAMIHATGLCMHDRLLARLLEDAAIAGARLPSELFARLLQLLAPVDNIAAVRCVVVAVHEFFRQQLVRCNEVDGGGSDGSRGDWQRLPLSADQYARVLQAVSRTSASHLLQPLLHAFRHSSRGRQRNAPQACTVVLPALRSLSHHQQHGTLLSLSSALLQWEALGDDSELWGGSQLSDVCEVLQLHFGSLLAEQRVVDEPCRSIVAAVPESWRLHLPSQTELWAAVPSLRQYLSVGESQPQSGI